ncbi:MAG: hypothetical protein Q8S33_01310 [Myxococcales bacterium]|nr:hypothetical protein [Myxococcales bacterium]
MNADALLSACLADRQDDAPRLVWADAVAGERGALVQVQCALSGRAHSLKERRKLQIHQRQLLRLYGWKWANLDGLASSCTFHRGFVDSARVRFSVFAERLEELFSRAPFLSGLTLETDLSLSRESLLEVLRRPLPSHLSTLGLPSLWDDAEDPAATSPGDSLEVGWGTEALPPIRSSAVLPRLRGLGLASGIGPTALDELLSSGELAHLEHLSMQELSDETSLPSFKQLRTLTVANARSLTLDRLPETLDALDVHGHETISRLARSPPPRLRRLRVQGSNINWADLSRLRTLRSFAYDGFNEDPGIRAEELTAFLDQPFEELEELRLSDDLLPSEVRLVVERFGRQLHLIDLPHAWQALRETELYELVDGELRFLVKDHGSPMTTSRTQHDSMFDHFVLRAPARPGE